MSSPRIDFGQMKGFPALLSDDKKIVTQEFLDACREIVRLIESFGAIFTPVVYDVNGNIERLHKLFLQSPLDHQYLQDMIALDVQRQTNMVQEPLLWLKRALELMHSFFDNILSDQSCGESLTEHMLVAYTNTLRPFHGWLVREAFNFIYRWLPYRSQLIGKHKEHDENVKHLQSFLERMHQHLFQINQSLPKSDL